MIETCMGNMYLSFFIYLVMRNLLFFLGLRMSKGEIKGVVFITIIIDAIFIAMFPLLILMTGGVCG